MTYFAIAYTYYSLLSRSNIEIQFPLENLYSNNFKHLGLLAKIKVLGVLPAHLSSVLDAGTVWESVPLSSFAGFVCCHCTGRWAVLDNTHGKERGAFR